jgi:hypothetical protein
MDTLCSDLRKNARQSYDITVARTRALFDILHELEEHSRRAHSIDRDTWTDGAGDVALPEFAPPASAGEHSTLGNTDIDSGTDLIMSATILLFERVHRSITRTVNTVQSGYTKWTAAEAIAEEAVADRITEVRFHVERHVRK